MARTIGAGKRIGTVNVGWIDPYGDFDYFYLDFGDYTARLTYEDRYATWRFQISVADVDTEVPVYTIRDLYRDSTGGKHKGALDAGTVELVSWFLTDALA
jgi:hypothetical protein